MELKRIVTPHQNPNDCWNLVISALSGMSYNETRSYALYNVLIESNGSMAGKNITQILSNFDYVIIDLQREGKWILIKDVLTMFYNYKVAIASHDIQKVQAHISYAYQGTHYTTNETDADLNHPVYFIWINKKDMKGVIYEDRNKI